jgi:hypothetical protein
VVVLNHGEASSICMKPAVRTIDANRMLLAAHFAFSSVHGTSRASGHNPAIDGEDNERTGTLRAPFTGLIDSSAFSTNRRERRA